jgi:hypothetical protein
MKFNILYLFLNLISILKVMKNDENGIEHAKIMWLWEVAKQNIHLKCKFLKMIQLLIMWRDILFHVPSHLIINSLTNLLIEPTKN